MSAFLMPSLGADMEAGTLVEQIITPGEPIHRGDIIGAVETQKGVIEVEVFEDGILKEWLVEIGDKVPVGTPLAFIRAAGDPETPDLPEPKAPEPSPPEAPQPVDPGPEPIPPEDVPLTNPSPSPQAPEIPGVPDIEIPPRESMRRRITPAARRLAARRGIDVTRLGINSNRIISRKTVEAVPSSEPQPPDGEMRRAIATAMSRSKREIPHFYLSHAIDVTVVDAFMTSTNADRPPATRLLPGAIYACAIARALKKYPEFNGHFRKDRFQHSTAVHLGFAVNLRGGGLVAPALFDVNSRSPDAVMQDLRNMVARARAGRFRAREFSDATITLSSLGERGVDQLYGVIHPPQVAIVGVGTPALHPSVKDGQVVPRLLATLTLAADHRVSDGHRGALFLRSIDQHLQKPEAL